MARKAQNSILLLTTLGVYLGLLVAGGAAPQVLAHSATTRNFEITDEIEIKDDIDRDPDERVSARLSLATYFQDVEYFVNTLKRLGGTKYFDPSADAFEVIQTTQLPCVAENKVGSYTANNFVTKNEFTRPWLESFSKLLTDGYSLGDCLPNSRFDPLHGCALRDHHNRRGNRECPCHELFPRVPVCESAEEASRMWRTVFRSVRSRG